MAGTPEAGAGHDGNGRVKVSGAWYYVPVIWDIIPYGAAGLLYTVKLMGPSAIPAPTGDGPAAINSRCRRPR